MGEIPTAVPTKLITSEAPGLAQKEFNPPPFVDALIYFDVDQTLAGDNLVVEHIKLYRDKLAEQSAEGVPGYVMPDEEWEGVQEGKYVNALTIPSIEAYRNNPQTKARFDQARNEIRTDYELHANTLDRVPDSLKGVWRLTVATSPRGYYTVRPMNNEMEKPTKAWLGRDNQEEFSESMSPLEKFVSYPNHENVVLCKDPEDKIRKILEDEQAGSETWPKVLIDDGIENLGKAVVTILDKNPELRPALSRLVLVGFRTTDTQNEAVKTMLEDTGVRFLTLPSWEAKDVDRMLGELKAA